VESPQEADVELVLQTLIVGVLVTASAVLATWKLMPARAKLRALNAINPSNTTAVGRWLSRRRKSVADELAFGCNACSKSSEHIKKHAPN
jgi:hypothetical protein